MDAHGGGGLEPEGEGGAGFDEVADGGEEAEGVGQVMEEVEPGGLEFGAQAGEWGGAPGLLVEALEEGGGQPALMNGGDVVLVEEGEEDGEVVEGVEEGRFVGEASWRLGVKGKILEEVLAEEDAVFVGEGEPGLAAGAVRGSGEDEAEV
ncbi:MAG: hypothetical protein IPF85_27465, partial [Anaerolineae bacterium]|nr:hypothetical protein [Anaerolineae bacterium]